MRHVAQPRHRDIAHPAVVLTGGIAVGLVAAVVLLFACWTAVETYRADVARADYEIGANQ